MHANTAFRAAAKGVEMGVKSRPTKPRPLWLEVRTEGITRRFCFLSENDRSISVGTLPRADVRITRPGVAPIHFHFERRGDQIWLVSGGEADLRLNAARVDAPRAIGERAIIEFVGVVVAASASAEPPGLRLPPSAPLERLELELADLQAPAALAAAALQALPPSTPLPPIATLHHEPIGHQETVRMFRVDISDSLDQETRELVASIRAQDPGPRWARDGDAIQPLDQTVTPQVTLRSDGCSRTPVSGDVPPAKPGVFQYDLECEERTASYDHESWLALERALDATDERSTERSSSLPHVASTEGDGRATKDSREIASVPMGTSALPGLGFVASLGARAQRQPVVVGAGAIASALVLSLALVGLSNVVSRRAPSEPVLMASVSPAHVDVVGANRDRTLEPEPQRDAVTLADTARLNPQPGNVASVGSTTSPPSARQAQPGAAASTHLVRRKVSPAIDEGSVRGVRGGLDSRR